MIVKDKEKVNAYNREHYRLNRDSLLAKRRQRYANSPTTQLTNRKLHLKHRYNMTLEEYEEMLVEQNGVCAICKLECESGQRLSIDHNHQTGEVRALLCKKCNRHVGQVERAEVKGIFEYLRRYES